MIKWWGIGVPALALVLAGVGGACVGQGISAAHNRLIDGRLSSQFQSTRATAEAEAAERQRQLFEISANTGSRIRSQFQPMARQAALKYDIPPAIFEKLVTVESAWNPKAVSPKGAIGLAQLMPFTARHLGVNPRDPRQNLEGGARYLAQQYRRFGSWRLALAAYNAGPKAVEKYGGVPPYRETRNYVKKILGP